jgi:hypothetical protein
MPPEVLAAIITSGIALFAAAIAVAWPSLQARERGRKFERIIRRELGELNPYPKDSDENRGGNTQQAVRSRSHV